MGSQIKANSRSKDTKACEGRNEGTENLRGQLVLLVGSEANQVADREERLPGARSQRPLCAGNVLGSVL